MRETVLLFCSCNSQKGGRSDLSVSQGNPPAAAHKSKKQQNKSKHTNRTPRNKTAIETKKARKTKPVYKHCQRHNGPEGRVQLTKVACIGHITNSNTNLDQISSSAVVYY